MNKNQFKLLWISVQVLLFILPIGLFLGYTPYGISKDQHMVDTVNARALNDGYAPDKLTDFSDAVIAKNDAEQKYEERVWKLQNKELYYFESFSCGLLFGLLFQIINLLWSYQCDELYMYN